MKKRTKARTHRELAKAVGRAPSAVSRWVEDPGWPFSKSGPWDVAAVEAWLARTLRPRRSNDDGPLRKAETAEKLARTQLLRFQLAIKRGELHHADDCRRDRVARLLRLKNNLLALPRELEPTIGADNARLLAERIRAMLKALSEGK